MAWNLIGKPSTQKVTKKLAVTFADMEASPQDRPLSERRLQVYRRLLAEGKFRPVTWASAICTETGGLYRVNGKHTSVLLASTNPLPDFYVVIEEYECDTLSDVAKLYSTFDSSVQSRTAHDIYLSFAGTITELAGLRQTLITPVVTGIAFYRAGADRLVYDRTQPAERAEHLLDNADFALWLQNLIGGVGNRYQHLKRKAVIAAMYGCYEKSKLAATHFWAAVRDEDGASPGCPDRMLGRWLLTSTLSAKQTRAPKATDREVYVKCLHAWNAWRNKTVTNLRYFQDAPLPTVK